MTQLSEVGGFVKRGGRRRKAIAIVWPATLAPNFHELSRSPYTDATNLFLQTGVFISLFSIHWCSFSPQDVCLHWRCKESLQCPEEDGLKHVNFCNRSSRSEKNPRISKKGLNVAFRKRSVQRDSNQFLYFFNTTPSKSFSPCSGPDQKRCYFVVSQFHETGSSCQHSLCPIWFP